MRAKRGDITSTIEPWTFRSESNKNGSTKKHIDFPPPVGSDTKVFRLLRLYFVLRRAALFEALHLAFCMSGLKRTQTCQPSP